MADKLYPALMITNIKNFIPIILEMKSGQYTSWAELFRIHCQAFQVIDHIEPPSLTHSDKSKDTESAKDTPDPALWSRLDAIVIQWIYSTISNDLLHTILKPKATAHQLWKALEGIFQDNQNERALYLEHKLVTTRLVNHPNCSAYCQALKMLADQLSNVGSPISDQRLVLQLIAGLPDSYGNFAMILQQTKPLVDFYEARSRLILEESRRANTAMVSSLTDGTALNAQTPPSRYSQSDYNNRGRGKGRGGRGGRGRGGRGRGNSGRNTTWTAQQPQWAGPTWTSPQQSGQNYYPHQPPYSYVNPLSLLGISPHPPVHIQQNHPLGLLIILVTDQAHPPAQEF
jgi:hypothetical protein